MKIKLSSIYASPNCTAHPGSTIDVSEEEGRELVAGRFGVEVPDTAPAPEPTEPKSLTEEARENPAFLAETAAEAPAETAALPPKPRKRIRG